MAVDAARIAQRPADLLRDPRILVHGIVTSREGRDGEYKLRGRARVEEAPERLRGYADEVAAVQLGWTPEVGRFHLFAVEVEEVSFIRYEPASGDQFVARWPAGIEFVRRGTSSTSLGPREPHQELLDP